MIHPVRKMIESLHADDACPRIHVDLTRDGVTCPDFVVEQWKEELVIDLDPTYPLSLAFTDDSVEADLSFDGYVVRCTFPFSAIYFVADRETGRGIVLDENMPESVRRKRKPAAAQRPKTDERSAGKRGKAGESRRRRRPRAKPTLGAVPDVPDVIDAEAGPAVAPAEVDEASRTNETGPDTADDSTSENEDHDAVEERDSPAAAEEEAQRRRSVFRVIDGEG